MSRDGHPGKEPPRLVDPTSLVGYTEIAARLKMSPGAIRACRHRNTMPTPLAFVSGMPVWCWEDVEDWARATGRWPG